MNYLFPYHLVPSGSKIILYGAGNVGKDFYAQLCLLNNNQMSKKYFIEAWVNKEAASMIKNELQNNNIAEEKIIWSESYKLIGREILPKDTALLVKNFNFYDDILKEYINDKSGFGESKIYQSFEKIGLEGQRNTEKRIEIYNIKNFLNKTDVVLDIGCNCGFLDMQIAAYVKKVVGYEISPSLVNIANKVSKFLNINNVEFHCENFTKNTHLETYNAVFAFAIHTWLIGKQFTEENFVNLMYNLLQDNGYLFFESNDMKKFDESFQKLCSMFIDKNMKICLHEKLSDQYRPDIVREVLVLKKC